ncbi:MAG: ModD protein [Rhodocyclaceae bacterium]|nr:ModD protein [Rhodocyclaceae bacterium]
MNPYTLSDEALEALLQADAPLGDLTTHGLAIGRARGRMRLTARDAMTVCGVEEARRMGALRGLTVSGPALESGQALAPGDAIVDFDGDAAALHLVWKAAQTFIESLSGIATATAALVQAAAPDARVACTRKHFPGTKAAALKAVLCAGASAHRHGLSESLLVFPEHRVFLPDADPAGVVARLAAANPEKRLVVEVTSPEMALEWAEAGADVLQLEKLGPGGVAEVVAGTRHLARPPVIAAAGGITAANAAAYVAAGAQVLVTSAPYQAPPRDVQVRFSGA